MMTSGGTSVETWVSIDGSCPVGWDVIEGEVQLRFGSGKTYALELIADEQGVENLIRASQAALRRLRKADHSQG